MTPHWALWAIVALAGAGLIVYVIFGVATDPEAFLEAWAPMVTK